MLHNVLIVAGLMSLFSFLDRLCGGEPQVPGRGIYYVILLAAVCAALSAVLPSLQTPLLLLSYLLGAFVIYREPAWWSGALAPYPDQYAGAVVRQAMCFGLGLWIWYVTGDLLQGLANWAFFTCAAFGLSVVNRKEADQGKDVNGAIEHVRGALWGLLAAIALVTVPAAGV